MADKIGVEAEIVIRSDGRAVWLNVDGQTIVRVGVERVRVEDQRQTTDAEILGYVAVELRELLLKASQYELSNKRKVGDAKAERRIADSHRYEGRMEVWARVWTLVNRILDSYDLKERH